MICAWRQQVHKFARGAPNNGTLQNMACANIEPQTFDYGHASFLLFINGILSTM
jgi:hypothetical protein